MKKSAALLLAASLAFGSVPAALAAQTTFSLTTDVSVQIAEAKAFEDIKALFSAQTVDLQAVKARYAADFQAQVKAVNAEIDTNIIFTLDAAIAGNLSVKQAQQAVDKGLQWYFYNVITNLTKVDAKEALAAGDKAKAKASLEKAIELYGSVLAPTATKRDNYYADLGVRTREQLDTIIVPGMIKAVEDGNVLSFNLHRQMFDKTLIKVFHLATLKYAKTAPVAEDATAKVEMTEGYFFFMPIYNSLSGGSKADADAIKNAFGSGDKSKLSEAEVQAAYAGAFNGKISGYVQKTVFDELATGKFDAAQEHAMEGNMFLAAQEVLIKTKLGNAAYEEASKQAEQYFLAVVNKDAEAANEHAVGFLKVLAKLDGVILKIGEDKLLVDGQAVTVDASAYINPETNRTLVPTRFIAQALGAEVSFNPSTNVVTIVKGALTTELTLASDAVKVNGEVKADLKLDQQVVVKDSYSYIPLRAVAELFGNKVFYANGEVVITK